MSTQTTDQQVQDMRALAEAIGNRPGIQDAWIDDWGRHGNFTLMVRPDRITRHASRSIACVVRKQIKAMGINAHIREVFGFDAIRKYDHVTESLRVVGYERSYCVIDIDYQVYDWESNTFSEQAA